MSEGKTTGTFRTTFDRLPDDELDRLIEGLQWDESLNEPENERKYIELIGDAGEIGEDCLQLALEVRDRRIAERLYGYTINTQEIRTR